MHDLLREGDFDVMRLERVPDGEEDLRGEAVLAVVDAVDPEFDGELDAAVAEGAQLAIGAVGFLQDEIELRDRLFDDTRHEVDIGVVADREGRLVTVGAALIGVVHNTGGDEILVWDHDPAAIESF